MPAVQSPVWHDLDSDTRAELDARFLEELRMWWDAPLSDEGARAYLAYRRERPDAAVTTYEEGQIRKMLRRHAMPSTGPDPVTSEEHLDRLESFGADRLHLTHERTYLMVMVILTLAAISVGMFWAILA